MNYQAAIFDMDGLLLDTERVCMSIFKQACDTLDIPFLDDVYPSIIGRNSAGIEQTLRAAYDQYHEYPKLQGEREKKKKKGEREKKKEREKRKEKAKRKEKRKSEEKR